MLQSLKILQWVSVKGCQIRSQSLCNGSGLPGYAANLSCIYGNACQHCLIGCAQLRDISAFLGKPLVKSVRSNAELQASLNSPPQAIADNLFFRQASLPVFR